MERKVTGEGRGLALGCYLKKSFSLCAIDTAVAGKAPTRTKQRTSVWVRARENVDEPN